VTASIQDIDIRDIETIGTSIIGGVHVMAEHITRVEQALQEATAAYQRLRDFAQAVIENEDTPTAIAAQASAALGTTPAIETHQ
jgi:hypothetical protein